MGVPPLGERRLRHQAMAIGATLLDGGSEGVEAWQLEALAAVQGAEELAGCAAPGLEDYQTSFARPPLQDARHGVPEEGDNKEWETYVPLQLSTVAGTLVVQRKHGNHRQHVGVTLQVQPSVKLHTGSAAVRLEIECLSVGVSRDEALLGEEDGALGFYPSRVTIRFKPSPVSPVVPHSRDGPGFPQCIARYITEDKEDGQVMTKRTSTTRAQLNLSLNPGIVLGNTWGKEQQVSSKPTTKVSTVRMHCTADVALFVWEVKRWKSGGGTYDHKLPHKGLSFFGTPKLPFEGATVTLDGQFPQVEWKLPPTSLGNLSFQVEVEIQMDLVQFGRNKLSAVSSESKIVKHPPDGPCKWLLRKTL